MPDVPPCTCNQYDAARIGYYSPCARHINSTLGAGRSMRYAKVCSETVDAQLDADEPLELDVARDLLREAS